MKTRKLFITTILSAGLVINCIPATYAADSITKETVKTANSPISNSAITDPGIAASSFVEHVNYARVALAMKNTTLAKQHVTQARNMALLIKGASTEEDRVTQLESGRIVYKYDTEYKNYYFPIETGPVQVKQISNGPIWAKNDLAVTDADIVYLTLDLSDDDVETYLSSAEDAIAKKDLKEADNKLAKLIDEVVSVDNRVSVPSDKAHDNIALARNFIAAGNYDGANYALKHADDALDEMQKNYMYKAYLTDIISMRKDVKSLQEYIAKKDPNLIQKANLKLDKWLDKVKGWTGNKS